MSPGNEFEKQSDPKSDSTSVNKTTNKINFSPVDTEAYYKYHDNYNFSGPDTGILAPAKELLSDPHALTAEDYATMHVLGDDLKNRNFDHIGQIIRGFKKNPEHLPDLVKSLHLELEIKGLDKRYEVGIKDNVLYVLDQSEASATSKGHYRYFSPDGKIIPDKP